MNNYVLITGGAGSIGSATVKKFINTGHKVVIIDIDDETAKKLISLYPSHSLYYKTDVTDINQILELKRILLSKNITIKHFISLAGGALIQEFNGLEKLDSYLIEESIKLNLNSHILLAKNLLPLIKKCKQSNKSISFISSINALMDFGLPAYSASKSGLLGITKVLSSEIGKYNIRVNSILPGTVLTKGTSSEPKAYSKYIKGSLLNRFTTTDEIAEVIYCISEKLTCITGQQIIADCGQTVKGYYENF